ncbi:hypothetical protein [Humibacter sp. RRB41]|uniref:hypothetical protein n=1 Tax=Humibacter sp. RRB41 TaxID=2919946 RepID=UPI001FAA31BE|nr:hypothetical protein [Humibacter sp. RRB41]
MGLFNRIKDPVDGQFNLVSCSIASGGAVYENCSMDGVVSGPGVTPTSVHHSSLATPVAKWPQPGQTLPVTFDREHPDRLKIRWDQMPTNREVAQMYAAQQAQQMAAAQATGASVFASPSVIGDPSRPLPGAPGGGLTPQESAQALAGGAVALGLLPTTARVLAAYAVQPPAGVPTAPGGVWDLTLDVTPVGGNSGYSTVMRIGFSSVQKQQTIAAIGRELPVLADPQRHDRIMIDTSRLA